VACLAVGWAGQVRATGFDGSWSVLVVTEKGTCDRAYRYGVRVAEGQLKYEGEASVAMDGTVAPNGAVRVNIRLGGQGANGTGRLTGNGGAGIWRGAGKSGDCSGTWEAERR
jgi:hypothetical protein